MRELTHAQLHAQWRECQRESSTSTDQSVIDANGRHMAEIVAELERRRTEREMELTR